LPGSVTDLRAALSTRLSGEASLAPTIQAVGSQKSSARRTRFGTYVALQLRSDADCTGVEIQPAGMTAEKLDGLQSGAAGSLSIFL